MPTRPVVPDAYPTPSPVGDDPPPTVRVVPPPGGPMPAVTPPPPGPGPRPSASPAGGDPGPARVVAPDPQAAPLIGDVPAALRVLAKLADGLAHAHSRGVLHLDLKPANVLLADSGEPMLLDFNLAFDAREPKREMVGGTVPYMAPEQLIDFRSRGKGHID